MRLLPYVDASCSMNLRFLLIGASLAACAANAQDPFPGTAPLTWTDDLSARMHEAALHSVDKIIADAPAARGKLWHRDLSSPEAYAKSVEPNRDHFKLMLGLVDKRLPVRMETFGDGDNPALVAESAAFTVHQARWPALEGSTGDGLLFTPKRAPLGHVVVVPDADQTPEQVAGLAPGVEEHLQFARYFASLGYEVVVPMILDRDTEGSGNAHAVMTNQPRREWIHRQAYMMGRHLIGFEVQKVMAAVDWFEKHREGGRIGVAGYGEGGLIALYAAAVDTRIDAALVSGYFKPRQQTWEEPLYRNVWGLLREFGDAEIASLVAPRSLIVEHRDEPKVDGPPAPAGDQKKCAAPGRHVTPSIAEEQ